MRRSRKSLWIPLILVLVYGMSSLRRLDAEDRLFVVDYPLFRTAPGLVEPGWRFVPRLIGRLSEYPIAPVRLRIDLSGDRAAASSEGARVEVEVNLTYLLEAGRVLDLHRKHGPRYETTWLQDRVRRGAAAKLATASYEVVRTRDPEFARMVRADLDEQVGSDGVRITALRILQIAGAGESSGAILRAEAEPVERDVVVIGVDSFDWRLIDPLMEDGRMPNLTRLVQEGVRANLRTIRPILSPVIWTSVATGVKPSRHGIVDFVVTARDSGALIPVTSAMRQVPALWTLLSRQGIEVDVVAWWATWPAETVRGRIVTDRVAYQLFQEAVESDWKSADPEKNRGKTFPPDLIDEVRPLILAPADVTDEELAWFLPDGRLPETLTEDQRDLLDSFRTVIAAGRTYHAISLELFRSQGRGLKMVYYEGPDTASHLFMRYRPPLLAGVDPEDMELFGSIVERYYERQDLYIGEVLETVGPDATVILLSDHGFKSDTNRPPNSDPRIGKGNAAEWHTPVGVLVMSGPDIRSGVDLGAASILDAVPTVLALYGLPTARDMDGQPLVEAIRPGFLEERPVAWVDSYGGFRDLSAEGEVVASAEDAELIEKLRGLGYIGEERLTASNNRGVMALEEGDIDGAIVEFERALATAANRTTGTMTRTNLARAWLQKGELEKARTFASQALEVDPRNKQAMSLLAGVAIKREDLDDAERHLRGALEIDPTFSPVLSQLARLHVKQGDDDAALAELRRVVSIAPLSPVEYNSIGNIHRRRGDIDAAMEAYREALRCDAQYIGAYNNLGLCLQERGELAEARKLYEKALAIRPENPILRNSLGTLFNLQGDKQQALSHLERAVKASPDWPVAQGNLATVLFDLGRLSEAVVEFERWVEIESESVDARLGYALSLLMSQRREEAVAQFEEVLRRDPENLRAHIALGETWLRGGELEGARTHLEKAAKLGREIPRIHNSLGETYMQLGLKERAARSFERSLALDPDQDPIRQRLAEAGG
jgi:tetratricopeptide (TPR) repeat protein